MKVNITKFSSPNFLAPLASAVLGLIAFSLTFSLNSAYAQTFTEAVVGGQASGNFHLRYETVEQDNALEDATALTLRSMIGYTTDTFEGFSARLEVEDVRIVAGQDEYATPPAGFNAGIYSVVADPEVTEVNQAFVQYKNEGFSARVGRQLITYDNHRFIGSVAWRQDYQTFDGVKLDFTGVENLSLSYSYLEKRNRIFGEAADFLTNDHLLNASYKLGTGTLGAYVYLLDNDDQDRTIDTYGIRYVGKVKLSETDISYTAEYATQENEIADGTENDADYLFFELGAGLNGIQLALGYEVLGSDDGEYGFSTPLATLHKFNGWADIFLTTPAQGLEDFYISASTKVGGGKLALIYHDFSADDATDEVDDLGDEWDLLYAKKFGEHYNAGIKYAMYSAGDTAVDTDKLWIWGGMTF